MKIETEQGQIAKEEDRDPAGPYEAVAHAALMQEVNRQHVDVPSRPSVEVAIDTLSHLSDRIGALLGRIKAWDLRALPDEIALRFSGAVSDVDIDVQRLGAQLVALQAMGFEAKTTPTTRLLAKLCVNSKVKLTEKAHKEFLTAFKPEQLEDLQVTHIGARHVFITSGTGTSLGLVKLSCIEAGE